MDAALTNLLAIVPYAKGAEQDRLLKEVLKKLPGGSPKPGLARALPPRPGMPEFTIPPAEGRDFRTWKSLSGSTVEATLAHERNGTIALQKRDGSKVEIQGRRLSREDQSYLQEIRGELSNQSDLGDGK